MWFNFHLVFEQWKYNKDYEVYVSSLGNIKAKKKLNRIDILIDNGGYPTVRIQGKNKVRYVYVHTLVMKTFNPQKDYQGLTVDHINSNKRDNSTKNLEWVTEEENLRRAQEKLLITPTKSKEKNNKNVKKPSTVVINKIPQGPFYIFDSYGNKFKSCKTAAISTLKANGFRVSDTEVAKVSSAIGQCLRTGDKYFGTFWYCRNLQGEQKVYTK